MKQQHPGHQHHLDDGRRELQQQHAHDGLDRIAPALQDAREPAGPALQMKAQRQQVHVLERAHGEPPHRVHRHLGEDRVARLGEQRHHHAHAAIGDRHHHRRRQRPGEDVVGTERRGAVTGERVGRPLEGERHRDRRELGGKYQQRGNPDAHLEVAPIGRPDVRPQMHERREQRVAAAAAADFALETVGRPLEIAHYRCGVINVGALVGRDGRTRPRFPSDPVPVI